MRCELAKCVIHTKGCGHHTIIMCPTYKVCITHQNTDTPLVCKEFGVHSTLSFLQCMDEGLTGVAEVEWVGVLDTSMLNIEAKSQ